MGRGSSQRHLERRVEVGEVFFFIGILAERLHKLGGFDMQHHVRSSSKESAWFAKNFFHNLFLGRGGLHAVVINRAADLVFVGYLRERQVEPSEPVDIISVN